MSRYQHDAGEPELTSGNFGQLLAIVTDHAS